MSEIISIFENGLYLFCEVNDDLDIRLLHLSSLPYEKHSINDDDKKWFRLVELQLTGQNHDDHHGSKNTGTLPGKHLRFN